MDKPIELVNQIVAERFKRKDTFEEHSEAHIGLEEILRHDYARGIVIDFILAEAEELLAWTNVNLRLNSGSPSWKKLVRQLQSAAIRAYEGIAKRSLLLFQVGSAPRAL